MMSLLRHLEDCYEDISDDHVYPHWAEVVGASFSWLQLREQIAPCSLCLRTLSIALHRSSRGSQGGPIRSASVPRVMWARFGSCGKLDAFMHGYGGASDWNWGCERHGFCVSASVRRRAASDAFGKL